MRVCARKCDTCIFSKNAPVRPGRIGELREKWNDGMSQICHHFGHSESDDDGTLIGENVKCRGWYDANVSEIHRVIGERLGYVLFVEPGPVAVLASDP